MAIGRMNLVVKRSFCSLQIVCGIGALLLSTPAWAQSDLEIRLKAITDQLRAQQERLAQQDRQIRLQQEAIEAQRGQITQLSNRNVQSDPGATSLTRSPVGEAPPLRNEEPPPVIQSLPQGVAVLTPPEHFTLMPSVEYTQTTNDRLVFQGVVIVPGINLGQVTASTDDRSIVSTALDLRYGLLDRLEVEARIPFTFSDDRATVLVQAPQGAATQSMYVYNTGIGDAEFGARYQINAGRDDWPVFVANGRFKLDTGTGPFDIRRDTAGIAQEVALGSGFMAVQGGFSVLKVSDPVVLYASTLYVFQIPKDINKTIGNVFVGRVTPSNSVNATFGFGFSVNPEFSFSMGYEHSHVFPQETELGSTLQSTTSLEVGAMTLGMAFRLSPTVSINTNFEFGVTETAPDVRAVISIPINF